MPETLLSVSTILLYGRVLEDVRLVPFAAPKAQPGVADESSRSPPQRLGTNKFFEEQLGSNPGGQKAGLDSPHLARIYAFSYEGHYYDLARPAIFLVHGPGALAAGPVPDPKFEKQRRLARTPGSVDRSGVAAQGRFFAEDIRVWSYDKGDFSIRMDAETGALESILLEAELAPERAKSSFSAKNVWLRGERGGNERD